MTGEGRAALYYAPRPDDPLWTAACAWLGRDPARGEACVQPDVPDIAALTAAPRRYGFHATLKPPMRLHPHATVSALMDAAAGIAAGIPAFPLPPLRLAELDGFLAFVAAGPSPALQGLCDRLVAGLDAFRAPLSESDLARRARPGLLDEQQRMLALWGYPDVFACWQFHMTLSRRLDAAECRRLREAAGAHFAPSLAWARRVEDVCLFIQPHPGAPFRIEARFPLDTASQEEQAIT